jgi:hypothetical protein
VDTKRLIYEHMRSCRDRFCGHRHHRRPAIALRFRFSVDNLTFEGDHMQFSMLATQKVTVIGAPVDVNGNPSKAVLSASNYTSSDPTVFTVSPDPATPNGAIITGVGVGTATLTETATATEPDGTTTEQIQGVATIVLTAAPPPPPPVAAALTFTFGTPQ